MARWLMSLGATVVIASSVQIGAARAEIFNVCEVMPTKDGFVALRETPSPQGRLITKMHPGEIVVIDVKNGDLVRKNGFARVSHFPGKEMPNPGDPGYEKVRRGWAKDKLVDECG